MEIEFVLLSVLGSLLLAYLLHVLQKRRGLKKHIGELIFLPVLIISLILFPVSFFVGGWDGLLLGAVGVYLFFTSLTGFIFTKLLKKWSYHR